jgi:hypothetical protein
MRLRPVSVRRCSLPSDRPRPPDRRRATTDGSKAILTAAASPAVLIGAGTATTAPATREGAFEIEVTRADGSTVDVHLDIGFGVADTSPDRRADPDPRAPAPAGR